LAKRDATAYLFLDTNIYLEFKDFDQIDWPSVVGYKRVCIVVPPIILTELDSFKNDQRSERRQSRSRKIIKKLRDIIFSTAPNEEALIPGRAGVTLLALTRSPQVATYEGLDPHTQDDLLIASILRFTSDRPSVEPHDIILIGDDTGCVMKARSHNIRVQELADQFRLPDEPTAAQKELNQLKRQQPKLRLGIKLDDKVVQAVTHHLTLLTAPSADEIEQIYNSEVKATEWTPPPARSLFLDIVQIQPSYEPQEINRHAHERHVYLNGLRAAIRKAYAWEERRHRLIKVTFTLANDGTVPATSVVVQLIVPDGIEVYTSRTMPRKPEQHQRPKPPQTLMQILRELGSIMPPSVEALYARPPLVQDLNEPEITPYNSTKVTWRGLAIQQHLPRDLSPIVLEFSPLEAEQTYELRYQIFAQNLPKPAEGIISITVVPRTAAWDAKAYV
jgi:hypothetical protein